MKKSIIKRILDARAESHMAGYEPSILKVSEEAMQEIVSYVESQEDIDSMAALKPVSRLTDTEYVFNYKGKLWGMEVVMEKDIITVE